MDVEKSLVRPAGTDFVLNVGVKEQKKVCKCGRPMNRGSEHCITCHNKLHPIALSNKERALKDGQKSSHPKDGYILIKMSKHPRASCGFVREHILVMEDRIGRYLEEYEHVHHVNGIRDDNRIENLELWTKPHPSGIRAKDAVKWAKQILALYKNLK